MNISFENIFQTAMGETFSPYPYQSELASESLPDIVDIPTGLGKTAGIILSWIHKRLNRSPDTPRRLVYCLPMRVLVEQTYRNSRQWIENLANSHIIADAEKPLVYVLMGGEIENDWDKYPDRDILLIGTQDQLISRALNRGYTVSRFRWPIQFGLLNNDCLWVMDEIQLMGTGLSTTTQLQAFREKMGTVFPVRSVWMSATLRENWLNTVDFADTVKTLKRVGLSQADLRNPTVKKLTEASKSLSKSDCPADDLNKIADLTMMEHRQETRTLVVVNTVKRAVAIYQAVRRKKPKAEIVLVHSRFRPSDRQRAMNRLSEPPGHEGTVCIATQVVEAGVDVSAATLITDLAPWSSLVQRFGRCNRYGTDTDAKVIWLDTDLRKKNAALPYTVEELESAASKLRKLSDVRIDNLPRDDSEIDHIHVIRQKDVIELFDTTPDLSGMDIDISRFVRESDDHDCHVFWREIPKEGPSADEPSPSREELCSVPVHELKKMKELRMWHWDHLDRQWSLPANISPGMVLMLRSSDGGYDAETGWTGKKQDIPEPVEQPGRKTEESDEDDRYAASSWQTLTEHNKAVFEEMTAIADECKISDENWKNALRLAAIWHDAGKAHDVFQQALGDKPPDADSPVIWAKSGGKMTNYQRKGFRHELASAIAMLENGLPDLAAYLVAAHHGKVRLSIRSFPHEKSPPDPLVRFARGIWEGDILPETDLGQGFGMPQTILDLSYMELGEGEKGESWLARMIAIRNQLGPFRLAFLEALLRAADRRASEKAGS